MMSLANIINWKKMRREKDKKQKGRPQKEKKSISYVHKHSNIMYVHLDSCLMEIENKEHVT